MGQWSICRRVKVEEKHRDGLGDGHVEGVPAEGSSQSKDSVTLCSKTLSAGRAKCDMMDQVASW